MACEPRRHCGFRKCGGLYLVGDLSGAVPVEYLPTCIDYPFTRAATWAEPKRLLQGVPEGKTTAKEQERILLMWVGSAHYTPESFMEEAGRMGVSKRISAIPEDAKKGDVVALAHPAAMVAWAQADGFMEGAVLRSPHVRDGQVKPWEPCPICREVPTATALANMLRGVGSDLAFSERSAKRAEKELAELIDGKREKLSEPLKYRQLGASKPEHIAAVFCLFRLQAVELVLPASFAGDPEIQRKCEERGVSIVSVPDGDGDHVQAGWKLPSWLEEREPVLPGILSAAPTADSDEPEQEASQP